MSTSRHWPLALPARPRARQHPDRMRKLHYHRNRLPRTTWRPMMFRRPCYRLARCTEYRSGRHHIRWPLFLRTLWGRPHLHLKRRTKPFLHNRSKRKKPLRRSCIGPMLVLGSLCTRIKEKKNAALSSSQDRLMSMKCLQPILPLRWLVTFPRPLLRPETAQAILACVLLLL